MRLEKWGIVGVGLLLLGGCKDDPAGPGGEENVSITVDGSVAQPGTLLRVRIGERPGSLAGADGALGSTALTFVAEDDTTLIALTPELEAGVHQLIVNVAGRTGEASVQVVAGEVIDNPRRVIEDVLAALAEAVAAGGNTGGERYQEEMDSALSEAWVQFEVATPAEQIAVARLLSSLMPMLDGTLVDAARHQNGPLPVAGLAPGLASSSTGWGCARSLVRVASLVYLAIETNAAGAVLLLAPTLPTKLLGGAAIASAYGMAIVAGHEASEAFDRCATLMSVQVERAAAQGQASGSLMSNTAVPLYGTGQPMAYLATASYRPLNASDVANDPVIASFATALELLRQVLALAPEWVQDSAPALPGPIAEVSPTQRTHVTLTAPDVRLENVVPASVDLNLSSNASRILITARGVVQEATPFSFDIVSVEDPARRVRLHGELRAPMKIELTPAVPLVQVGSVREHFSGRPLFGCDFAWVAAVTGGHTGTWLARISSQSVVPITSAPPFMTGQSYPLDQSPFGYFTDQPLDFYYTMTYQYIDDLTGQTHTSNTIRMDCIKPEG